MAELSQAKLSELACWSFEPRPDQPEKYDQQTAFMNSRHAGPTFLLGGNGAGCCAGEQELYDPVLRKYRRIDRISGKHHVLSLASSGEAVIAIAEQPSIHGTEDLFEVALSNGDTIRVTLGHRLLRPQGWQEIADILRELHPSLLQQLYGDAQRQSLLVGGKLSGVAVAGEWRFVESTTCVHCGASEEFDPSLRIKLDSASIPTATIQIRDTVQDLFRQSSRGCAVHSCHKSEDCQDCYSTDLRRDGEQLPFPSSIDPVPFPQSSDALEHSHSRLPLDGQGNGQECTRLCRRDVHLSSFHCDHLERQSSEVQCDASGTCLRSFDADDIQCQFCRSSIAANSLKRVRQQFPEGSFPTDTIRSSDPAATVLSVSSGSPVGGNGSVATYITAIRFLRRDAYWDFHVPIHENYSMGGVWNHNTTTCGLAKAIDFMTWQQPAPRRDCPFWIIAGSYPQTMNACWKEKLHQKGHIDPNMVDWERISWYKPNQDWPFSVPLKPRAGHPGKNWTLVFKSYEQGRAAMQAEAIGGFLFVEQFPWGLLEEVMRGCREYSFVGNKLCEFTPVDPSLSIELRDMEENGKLPESWGIYRASTRCAMEAGNVSEQWYKDFFAMVPESMRAVREAGLWGNFEGAVYPEWNPAIHTIKGEWQCPPAWHHRRAVDFGFSMEHPFVCLWSASDGRGRTVIYDEYWSNDTSMSVIDHWKIIADRHFWPSGGLSTYYGTTWVDWDMDAIRTLSKINEYTDGEYDPPSMSLAMKDVAVGIEHVKYMLKPSMMITPGVLEPRLQVVRENCPHLCKEMITYRYHKQLTVGVNAQAVRDEPVKIKDDAVDTLRYILYSEANMSGVTPTTMAHQHSSGSVQVNSDKFKRQRKPKARKSIQGIGE